MIENNLDTLTEQQYLDLRYEIIKQLEEGSHALLAPLSL